MVNIRKRNKVYQYQFEIGKVDGKRKFISKSGFKTKNDALKADFKAYQEFKDGVEHNKNSDMLYSEYLDYWMTEYFEINYRYNTAKRYKSAFESIKSELGYYKIGKITSYMLSQGLLRIYHKENCLESNIRNIQKVIKSSFRDATDYFGFINYNPASTLSYPRILSMDLKKSV